MEYEVIEYVERPRRAEEARLREAAEAADRAYEDADAIWRDINRRYRRKVFQNPTPEMRRKVIAALDARNVTERERALAWSRYDDGARWMTKTVSISEDELIRRAVEAAKTAVEEDAIRALRPGGPGRWEWAHLPDDLAQQAARELSPEVGDEPSDFWIETFVSAYFTFAKRAEVSIKFPPTDEVLVGVAAERSERQVSKLLRPATVRSKSFVGTESRGVPCGRKRPNRDRDLVRDGPYRRTPLRSAARAVVAAGWPREAVVQAGYRAEETSSRATAQCLASRRRAGSE